MNSQGYSDESNRSMHPAQRGPLSYEERLEQYLLATGNDKESPKKAAVCLTVIGAETYALLRDLVHPNKPAYDELVAVLRARTFSTETKCYS